MFLTYLQLCSYADYLSNQLIKSSKNSQYSVFKTYRFLIICREIQITL